MNRSDRTSLTSITLSLWAGPAATKRLPEIVDPAGSTQIVNETGNSQIIYEHLCRDISKGFEDRDASPVSQTCPRRCANPTRRSASDDIALSNHIPHCPVTYDIASMNATAGG